MVMLGGQSSGVELVADGTHPVLGDLSPGIVLIIGKGDDLMQQDVIELVEIVIVLLLYVHISIIRLGDYESIIAMIDKFRDPAVIGGEIDGSVHGGCHATGAGGFPGHPG